MDEDRPTSTQDYRTSHVGEVARDYDDTLFGPGSFDGEVWNRERTLLDGFLERWAGRRERYLDFACGTGRVLAHLEGRFDRATGLDISPDMLAGAAERVKRADLVQGDATRDPGVVEGPFDCITAFRFFLHAERGLRDEVMAFLASRLRDRDSVLIFNVHGNRWSAYGLTVLLKRLLGRRHRTMTRREAEDLAERHGLEILEWRGLYFFDRTLHGYLPARLWKLLEGALRTFRFLERWSVYHYFVCRRAEEARSAPRPRAEPQPVA